MSKGGLVKLVMQLQAERAGAAGRARGEELLRVADSKQQQRGQQMCRTCGYAKLSSCSKRPGCAWPDACAALVSANAAIDATFGTFPRDPDYWAYRPCFEQEDLDREEADDWELSTIPGDPRADEHARHDSLAEAEGLVTTTNWERHMIKLCGLVTKYFEGDCSYEPQLQFESLASCELSETGVVRRKLKRTYARLEEAKIIFLKMYGFVIFLSSNSPLPHRAT
eukprot:COSAG01_NODE_4113_length_5338_cov_9.585226_2_plen_224_part_00